MAGYFILILGAIVFILHVPGLVIPERHRELGSRFAQTPSNFRLFGLIMVAIGAGAFLVSPRSGSTRWFLLLFGIYLVLSGLFLLVFTKLAQAKLQRFIAGSLRLWIGRAIVKCTLALAAVVWGAILISS